ncbi:hypothetical protein [Sphingobium sp. Z007]|uniref:hypothetical protein n=1 Tax=Sphingobium sp. Z007 TaxID=627495 RepID=UPI000B4A066A|nr:hypothetical protein [Sphingobium sp. Z007]
MIALPAILSAKSLPFAAGVLLGALVAWGPATCVGTGQANQATALKNEATAAKLEAVAARATKAAALTEIALAARTQTEIKELREIVTHDATNDDAGPGVDAVMRRLRKRSAAR